VVAWAVAGSNLAGPPSRLKSVGSPAEPGWRLGGGGMGLCEQHGPPRPGDAKLASLAAGPAAVVCGGCGCRKGTRYLAAGDCGLWRLWLPLRNATLAAGPPRSVAAVVAVKERDPRRGGAVVIWGWRAFKEC
jgi:hypothetical protein